MKTKQSNKAPAINSPEFAKLQAEWYAKLKQSGFEDAEVNEVYMHKYAGYFKAKNTPTEFQETQDFYYYATQKLQTGKFNSKLEYRIWEMFCDRVGSRETARRLKRLGYKRIGKDRVLETVRVLRERFK